MFETISNRTIILVLALAAIPAAASASRTLEDGTFPHRKTVDVWPEWSHLPDTREVASADWLVLYVNGWNVKDAPTMNEFLSAIVVHAWFDGIPATVEPRFRTVKIPYCDPADPDCLAMCPDGSIVAYCENPAGCDGLTVAFVALLEPQSIGTHVATGDWAIAPGATAGTPVGDGWCTLPASDLTYGGERTVLVTQRELYPTLPPTPR